MTSNTLDTKKEISSYFLASITLAMMLLQPTIVQQSILWASAYLSDSPARTLRRVVLEKLISTHSLQILPPFYAPRL